MKKSKRFKKLIAIGLAAIGCVSYSACGTSGNDPGFSDSGGELRRAAEYTDSGGT
ncbi:MAG: hypothetical protein MJ104_04540 [Lachnospiraceae bacterium]|nr:hypothetical protein [Lachnospiraceae bacterium]